MSEVRITLSRNTIKDRLRVLAAELTAENRHTDAMLVEIAIQAVDDRIGFDEAFVVQTMLRAMNSGAFDEVATTIAKRMTMRGGDIRRR